VSNPPPRTLEAAHTSLSCASPLKSPPFSEIIFPQRFGIKVLPVDWRIIQIVRKVCTNATGVIRTRFCLHHSYGFHEASQTILCQSSAVLRNPEPGIQRGTFFTARAGVRTCESAPFIPLTDRNKVNQEVSRLCGLAEILHRSERSRQERIVLILNVVSIGSADDDDTDSPMETVRDAKNRKEQIEDVQLDLGDERTGILEDITNQYPSLLLL